MSTNFRQSRSHCFIRDEKTGRYAFNTESVRRLQAERRWLKPPPPTGNASHSSDTEHQLGSGRPGGRSFEPSHLLYAHRCGLVPFTTHGNSALMVLTPRPEPHRPGQCRHAFGRADIFSIHSDKRRRNGRHQSSKCACANLQQIIPGATHRHRFRRVQVLRPPRARACFHGT